MRGQPVITDSMPAPASVLILRPDGVGDVVLFSGVLARIRGMWPSARIELVVSPVVHVDRLWSLDEFSAGPLDGIMNWRGNHRLRPLYRRARDLAARLTRPIGRRYDLLINPVRAAHAGLHDLVRRAESAEKIGIAGDRVNQDARTDADAEPWYSRRLRLVPDDTYTHELEITRRFLAWLGFPVPSVEDIHPTFWLSDDDIAAARRLLDAPPDASVLGVVPGSGMVRKCWPAERFAAVTTTVTGFSHIAILGGPADRAAAGVIEDSLTSQRPNLAVRNLAGRTTLRQLVAVVARCDALVGSDTGTMHMAVAQDRPTVVVLGGVPHRARFYPWSDPQRHRAVYREGVAFFQIDPDDVADCLCDLAANGHSRRAIAPCRPAILATC